jgi:hypothetical protein
MKRPIRVFLNQPLGGKEMSKNYKIYTETILLVEFQGYVKEFEYYNFPDRIVNGIRTIVLPDEFRLVCLDTRELAAAESWSEVMWLQTPLTAENSCSPSPTLSKSGLRHWVRSEFPLLGRGFDSGLLKVTEW